MDFPYLISGSPGLGFNPNDVAQLMQNLNATAANSTSVGSNNSTTRKGSSGYNYLHRYERDDSDDESEDDDDDGGGLLFLYTNLLYVFYKSRKTFFFYNILGDAKMNALKALAAVAFITCFFSLGSFIFSFFETWSFVDGFYFCFITMTTIGFGDMVPCKFFFI